MCLSYDFCFVETFKIIPLFLIGLNFYFFKFKWVPIEPQINVFFHVRNVLPPKTYFDYKGEKNIEFNQINTQNCQLCSFQNRNEFPNSSPNDVIFVSGIKKVVNLLIFAKTLRTTGSQAQIVAIVDQIAYDSISNDTFIESKNCGIQIFNVGHVDNLNPKYIGFELYLILIHHNFDFIDRVMVCDLYDTVFQGDPFSKRISRDFVQFIDEGRAYSQCSINTNWVINAVPGTVFQNEWRQLHPICSGYLVGGKVPFYKFLKVYCSYFNFQHPYYMDQGLLNNLLLTNVFQNNHVPIMIDGENFTIRHLAFNHQQDFYTKFGDFKVLSFGIPKSVDRYALVVHHYYALQHFSKSILLACPRRNKGFNNYHRTINDEEISKLEENI